jgi:hypothetical protein
MGFNNFRFKQVHSIGRQKTAKSVLRHYARDNIMYEQSAKDLLASLKSAVTSYVTPVCLSYEGEKYTLIATNALTGMDGSIVPRLCICLQELKGTFEPLVLQSVFTPENLTIDAFSLGRITSESWTVHKFAQQVKLLTCIWRVN